MSDPDENILDATCGGRSIWTPENKDRNDTLYIDKRQEDAGVADFGQNPGYSVEPDEVEDFRDLPYDDGSFNLVVFDPPHLIRDDGMKQLTGAVQHKYGALRAETWQSDLRDGFSECFRVLSPGGSLVFKFADNNVDFTKVIELAPEPPLFGTRANKGSIETRWFIFHKPE